MDPVWHIVLNVLHPDGRIVHDSVLAEFPGNRAGFKEAVIERDRLEADYLKHHPDTTEDGGRPAHEIEMW